MPLIKKAKEMVIYTIVASINGNYPGIKIADKVYYENTTDVETIMKIAKEENINGICTTGTDVAVITIGAICEKLNLSGISASAARLATNKLLMKEAFKKAKVRTADFFKVTTIEETLKAVKTLQLPVMFKAVDSSGSRGITKVSSLDEIDKAFKYSKKYTNKEYIVIEKFIDGYEIGIDGFVKNNKVELILPHGKLVHNNGDADVPIGHYLPFECSKELINDINFQFSKVVKAIGFNNCAINMDVLIKNEKVYVIEVGGRAGATCIPEIISIYCGFDYYEEIIKCALGEENNFKYNETTPCAAKLIVSDKQGIIKSIDIDELKNNNIVDLSLDYKVGDKVNKFKVGPDRIGQIIVKGTKKNIELNNIKLDIS